MSCGNKDINSLILQLKFHSEISLYEKIMTKLQSKLFLFDGQDLQMWRIKKKKNLKRCINCVICKNLENLTILEIFTFKT